MVIIMLASITLIPALFTYSAENRFGLKFLLLGMKLFRSIPSGVKLAVSLRRKPGLSASVIGTFLLICAGNMLNMTFEFDTMKSFPDDMESRQGYRDYRGKFP